MKTLRYFETSGPNSRKSTLEDQNLEIYRFENLKIGTLSIIIIIIIVVIIIINILLTYGF